MTINNTALLNQLLDARNVTDYFEAMHDTCLKNVVTSYTGSAEGMAKVALFIKQMVSRFAAPAVFQDENILKIENFLTDDVEYLSMGLIYAMQIFKHGKYIVLPAIAEMISQAWDVNYGSVSPSPEQCIDVIEGFPASLIVFMCMLFPNSSIGMLGQLMYPPTPSSAS